MCVSVLPSDLRQNSGWSQTGLGLVYAPGAHLSRPPLEQAVGAQAVMGWAEEQKVPGLSARADKTWKLFW